jgi:hypothetical protein
LTGSQGQALSAAAIALSRTIEGAIIMSSPSRIQSGLRIPRGDIASCARPYSCGADSASE